MEKGAASIPYADLRTSHCVLSFLISPLSSSVNVATVPHYLLLCVSRARPSPAVGRDAFAVRFYPLAGFGRVT